MSEIYTIMQHNQEFVAQGTYDRFVASKYPKRKLAILSCMDTRMTKLLPEALGLKNGDAKIIKNAGAVVTHPWGSVMRSLLISVFDLHVEEIMVIAHSDCGLRGLNAQTFLDAAVSNGIPTERIETLRHAGVNLGEWLQGFDNEEESVRFTVETIRNHPLMPTRIAIHGFIIHPTTGELTLVVDGNAEKQQEPHLL